MKILVNGKIQEWAGCWPAQKNSKRVVCVLVGTRHSGLDEVGAELLGTHFNRRSKRDYDWYRLPKAAAIAKAEGRG